jgi:hypothetical protein
MLQQKAPSETEISCMSTSNIFAPARSCACRLSTLRPPPPAAGQAHGMAGLWRSRMPHGSPTTCQLVTVPYPYEPGMQFFVRYARRSLAFEDKLAEKRKKRLKCWMTTDKVRKKIEKDNYGLMNAML